MDRKTVRDYLKTHTKCERCGVTAKVVSFIIPKSDGGTDDVSNLTALCKRCSGEYAVYSDVYRLNHGTCDVALYRYFLRTPTLFSIACTALAGLNHPELQDESKTVSALLHMGVVEKQTNDVLLPPTDTVRLAVDRLLFVRGHYGISVAHMAEIVGLDRVQIHRYLSRQCTPKEERALEIIEKLNAWELQNKCGRTGA